jgi:RHS repeat-associated protein
MDQIGTVVNSYEYDPFGVLLGKKENVGNPFQYCGEYGVMNWNNSVFMRARDYDVSAGRFVQADPIGISGGPNLYEYAANNPVSAKDPSGMSSDWSDIGSSIGETIVTIGEIIDGSFSPQLVGAPGYKEAFDNMFDIIIIPAIE